MNSIGFAISEKENELRRAITIEDFLKIKNKNNIFFEKGYFDILGCTDNTAKKLGANFLPKQEIYKCNIIIDPKIGDSEHLKGLKKQTIFGWIHATQNYNITQCLVDNELTAIAWEKMFDSTRHIFSENNLIAGKAAVIHAMTAIGKLFENQKVAILGNGNTSHGAQKIFNNFNIAPIIYEREDEEKFKNDFAKYDIIVNCILWDVNRKDHILYTSDLKKMKPGSIIIDVSCDHNGGIESSHPTTIENPIFIKNNVIHYAVDHTPSILHRDATSSISSEIINYIEELTTGTYGKILSDATIISNGRVIDNEITKFQNRHS